MKNRIVIILNILWLVACVALCLYGIYTVHQTFTALANTPGASGIDYWGIGWASGVALFILSAIGLLLCALSSKTLRINHCARLRAVSNVLYILLLAVSIILFYI